MPPRTNPTSKQQGVRKPTKPPMASSSRNNPQNHFTALQHIKSHYPHSVKQTYMLYILLVTEPTTSTPKLILRRTYDSQFAALEAFKREYSIWSTPLFPPRHTQQQLTGSYLINVMEMSKQRDASASAPALSDETVDLGSGALRYHGYGKVAYELVHREDAEVDENDPTRRKCVVVCEETALEKAN